MLKFKKIGLSLMAASLALLTACSASNPPASGEPGEPKESAEETKKVSIMLDWYPNAVHSFLYAGQEQGFFKEQGLELDIKMPAETNDPLKLVSTGEVDFALSYQPQVVMARAQQIPVVSVSAIVRHPLNAIMVPAESGISAPKDLAGKSVGYPAIPMNEAVVKTMVTADGGDAGQVELIDVGWDLMPAISTKKVDAISGGYINHEKVLLEKEGIAMNAFSPVDFGVPDYYELVLVTSEKTAKENPELIKQFTAAVNKGFDYVKANPKEGLDILLSQANQSYPLDAEVEAKSLEILLPLMSSESEAFGSQTAASWEAIIQWMKETKLIENDVKADESFITP
ncbi:ABC transporter substrate-binding protein [Ammoniphilus sp. 3BR4]|uniref:ABC transporter substrate-binding protein n=1 Tax=Ammoniphilus sp. 3BR4 TaxID=3158265 RepID=UPI0034663210